MFRAVCRRLIRVPGPTQSCPFCNYKYGVTLTTSRVEERSLSSPHLRHMNELPWRRHGSDRHLDQGRPVAGCEAALERGAKARGVVGALGRRAEAFGEAHEIRIGEV